MGAVFLCGSLCHAPLAEVVLGRRLEGRAARLERHGLCASAMPDLAVPVPRAGAEVPGLLIEDTDAAAARLDFYMAVFGAGARVMQVRTADGPVAARVYLAETAAQGAAWSFDVWVSGRAALATEAAREVMALYGQRAAEQVAVRRFQILVRAASRLRAREAGPTALRRRAAPGDVAVEDWRQPYARFFALEEFSLRFRRFDGTMSETVSREVFISGDAATVLPYDPVRDRVLVIEQFRPGPFARGDAQPWLIEPIAGRVDPDETPEEAVRREALEEAGLALDRLIPIASYYPTPAGKSEYLYSYLALADLPDDWRASASGRDEEHEDIRAHLVGFEALMALVESGEVGNGPLLVSALFLARARERLRGAA